MLQAHSFLWHYLWVAPNLLGLLLAIWLWRRGFQRQYPLFVAYLFFAALKELCLYVFDLSPKVSPDAWWGAFWVGTIIEGFLKFLVLAELLQRLLRPWPSVAKLARNLVSGTGVLLVLAAAVIAAFAAPDNTPWFIGGAHILIETLYFTLAGLVISIFLLVRVFHIPWDRQTFGIALGFGLVWCEHLALWALVTGGVVRNRVWIDFANMATYHVSVLIWYGYLLIRQKVDGPIIPPKDLQVGLSRDHAEALDVWNRELERLIH